MKKIIWMITLLLVVAGCQSHNGKDQTTEQTVKKAEEEKVNDDKKIEALITSRQSFHFIVDWLSDEEIVFVQLKEDTYHIVSYNIHTKEQRQLHQESAVIANVLVHPSKEYLLLHTSEDDHSATVKMIDISGQQIYELNIESKEIDIQWNDLEPRYLMLTAFYEDWTYDQYIYNAYENDLSLSNLDYPFSKWIGEEEIVLFQGNVADSLDGKVLEKMNIVSGERETIAKDILYYDTYKNSLLMMYKEDDSTAHFKVSNQEGNLLLDWKAPLVSNYSEWVIPEVFWLSEEELVTYIPAQDGLLDNLAEGFTLAKIGKEIENIVSGQTNLPLLCSPSNEHCITGPSYAEMLFLSSGEVIEWLQFEES